MSLSPARPLNAQRTSGLPVAHVPMISSIARAADSNAASPRTLPTICIPTGRPLALIPHGIAMTGMPVSVNA
ncbi:hypothetical protein B0G69_4425 [Paraburkholderia sp. RAU2J]|nr:hypothetical protein B0G69_4425 [Paraburkholderia sp. RAU2J]